MKTIIVAMLVVEAAVFLVTIFTAVFKSSTEARRPIWTGLVISLVIVASAANSIAGRHSGQPGTDILQGGSMVLIGMAIMTIMIAIRQRRGLA